MHAVVQVPLFMLAVTTEQELPNGKTTELISPTHGGHVIHAVAGKVVTVGGVS